MFIPLKKKCFENVLKTENHKKSSKPYKYISIYKLKLSFFKFGIVFNTMTSIKINNIILMEFIKYNGVKYV